ncbi:MAG: helix-turn-helix domain-containing protein [Actinomycetota bacterium]|nr:helix-turn-helix domain-containing protein [Actinomycetota bacterium]
MKQDESRQLQLELTRRVSWDGSDDELLDVKQAAALLTVQPSTLRYWAREGRVPCIRLGARATRWTRPLLRHIRDSHFDPGIS